MGPGGAQNGAIGIATWLSDNFRKSLKNMGGVVEIKPCTHLDPTEFQSRFRTGVKEGCLHPRDGPKRALEALLKSLLKLGWVQISAKLDFDDPSHVF